jgi:hypothetical protein
MNLNPTTLIALLTWPLVAFYLYHTRPVGRATLWTVIGAQLLLPAGAAIKFEGIPAFDKFAISSLAALIGCIFIAHRRLKLIHSIGLPEILVLTLVIAPFITSATNTDAIDVGLRIVPGVDYYDAASAIVSSMLVMIPFFLGRQFLRNSNDSENILRVLVIAGLAYSLPMLIEARMSPQFHNWIYGYHSSGFVMSLREDGYRPMIFMGHGLIAAFFAMITAVAAAALWRTNTKIRRWPPAGVTVYLSAILLLYRSMGAAVSGAILIPLVYLTRAKLQLRVAMVLVLVALLYPMLRTTDLVPTQFMVSASALVSEDRASSLQFRFDHERKLLDHASARLFFGWGRWSRNRIHDVDAGDVSVTDGRWIIMIGTFGIFYFLAEFGLLAVAVWRATQALKYAESDSDRIYLSALGLIVGITAIELIPNSFLGPYNWLIIGALLGRAEALLRARRSSLATSAFKPGGPGWEDRKQKAMR